MVQLDKIKIRLNIKDASKDELLTQLIEDAEREILDYCNRKALITQLEGLQRELVVVYFNRLGSEAESSRSEGGISVSYSTEMPQGIKDRLKAYRKLKVVDRR